MRFNKIAIGKIRVKEGNGIVKLQPETKEKDTSWTNDGNRGTISLSERIVRWKNSMRRDFSNFGSNTIYARFIPIRFI